MEEMKELVRILHTDLKGSSNIYTGLTRIKGFSWATSAAICKLTGIKRNKKAGLLEDSEIKKIEETARQISTKLPKFLVNMSKSSEDKPRHLEGSDLELDLKMKLKKLREIQSYKGIRHAMGLPVRGQKTKSNFRKGKSVGVVKKKGQPAKSAKKKQ